MALFMTVWGVSMPASAQNNAYKIHDQLYDIYKKAFNDRRTKQGLALADSMYRQAEVLKDKKAQCLALTIPFLYYYNGGDEASFFKAMDRLQAKALQTGYVQYYYWCNSYRMVIMSRNEGYQKMVAFLKQNQAFAKKHNHIYGIYSTYQNLGLAYLNNGFTLQAVRNFEEAIRFGQKYLPEQDMGINYRRLAQCYMVMGDHEKMMEYVEKGIKTTRSKQAYDNLLICRCYALFMLGRDQEFLADYDKACLSFGKINSNHTLDEMETPIQELKIFKLIIEGKDAEACQLIANIKMENERNRIWMAYYSRKGDFYSTQTYLRKLMKTTYLNNEKAYSDELTEVNAQLNMLKLENEKRKTDVKQAHLMLANTQLTLKNSSLELGRTKAAESLSKLNAENYHLSLNKKQLESRQLRDSLNAQKAKRNAQEKEMASRTHMLQVSLILAVVMLLVISIYVYNIRRMTHKLHHANRHLRHTISELSVANDKAQQADKMKTLFIQNMSHEIRTPLNAIVGFSQILAEMGDSIDEEEKKDMTDTIQDNSELLTTLINDILDITALESGRYVMKEEPVCVATLCRQALDTVVHRKAPGVELKLALETPEDYQVKTDATRVKQVLVNLLTNAEKNTDNGCITLGCSLHENPGMLTFSVTDTGIGIPEDKQDEIFERFKKLDRYKQGSGLGLSICTTIAERLGGQTYIDKNYHHGARFLFTVKAQ